MKKESERKDAGKRTDARERERERKKGEIGWALPRFVSDFIIMRTRAVVRRVNWKNGITSNHWPSLPRTKPQGEHPFDDRREEKGLATRDGSKNVEAGKLSR